MGLDWLVNYKPKTGEDNSFYKIKNKIKRLDKEETNNEDELESLRNALKEISITPEDTINSLSLAELKETEDIFEGGSFLTSNHDFRGQVVSYSELINDDLIEEAYKNHGAKKCIEYANKLEHKISEYKYDELEEEEQEDYNDINQAIKWLRFWGKHGHGFSAWY
jgi:hypothetical protein